MSSYRSDPMSTAAFAQEWQTVCARLQARAVWIEGVFRKHEARLDDEPSGWRQWFGAGKGTALARLEERFEQLERRAAWWEAQVVRAEAELALAREEVRALEERRDVARIDARAAAEEVLGVERSDKPAVVVDGRLRVLEADRRGFRWTEARIGELLAVQHPVLCLLERLVEALAELRTVAAEECANMAAALPHEAAAARVADLTRSAEALKSAVARVNLTARQRTRLLTQDLDRIREQVALLAPMDADSMAAEAEVLAGLKELGIAELVARARAEVAR